LSAQTKQRHVCEVGAAEFPSEAGPRGRHHSPPARQGLANRLRSVLSRALAVLLVAGLSQTASAARHEHGRERVEIEVSQGELLDLPSPASKIFVSDPAIADVQVPHATRVFVFGKKPGRTTLFALDADGATVASFIVVVKHDDADMQRLLQAEFGDAVSISRTSRGALLRGTVQTAEIAEKVRAVAAQSLGESEPLINQLRISGSLQVNLRVRIAEVSRTANKQLTVNWQAFGSVGGFGVGISNSGTGTAKPATGSTGYSVTAAVDALSQEGLISILAEPTLTAVSGQKANFLAGGEFPIPIAQGLATISVEYRRYGVGLEFTPTVLSNDLISLKVNPEVSELSTQGAVTINGIQIPALTMRRAETTVELGSGQSFVVGGLLQNGFSTEIDKMPALGDLPVLGPLFRSSQFRKNESELIIIVTPYIVRPIADSTRLSVPTDFVRPPSDLDRILFGHLGRTRPGEGAIALPAPGFRLRGDAGFMFE
jgi:pilus assembly protein CpaC